MDRVVGQGIRETFSYDRDFYPPFLYWYSRHQKSSSLTLCHAPLLRSYPIGVACPREMSSQWPQTPILIVGSIGRDRIPDLLTDGV